jgi:hypothetical protein
MSDRFDRDEPPAALERCRICGRPPTPTQRLVRSCPCGPIHWDCLANHHAFRLPTRSHLETARAWWNVRCDVCHTTFLSTNLIQMHRCRVLVDMAVFCLLYIALPVAVWHLSYGRNPLWNYVTVVVAWFDLHDLFPYFYIIRRIRMRVYDAILDFTPPVPFDHAYSRHDSAGA